MSAPQYLCVVPGCPGKHASKYMVCASVSARITEYLSVGGLLNPELMEHDKVRDLLMDCRTAIEHQREALEATLEFLPATRWEGDQYGFYEVPSGEALLAARTKVLRALNKDEEK